MLSSRFLVSRASLVWPLLLLGSCTSGRRLGSAGDADVSDRADAPDDSEVGPDGATPATDGAEMEAAVLHVWLTTSDLASHLTRQPDVVTARAGGADLTFDDSRVLQSIDGFGAAMTDTSADLLENALEATAQAQVMADLFDRDGGIGLSLVRVPMGSSDFTACSCTYSYDDGDAGPASGGFSTAHDDAYILPAIRRAQSINPQMKLFANPWSPPAWMKSNGSMLGTAGGRAGTLSADAYDALAEYFVRFVEEYRAKGVAMWGITPQNEPSNAPDSYSGMLLSASDEADLVANHLAPAMADAGLSDIKILGGDDVGASLSFAQTLFANDATASALYATAWHCYTGLSDMSAIHRAYPDKPLYMTECSTGPSGIAGDAAQQVLAAMSNWASGAVLWNVALDPNGGPKMGFGCVGCTGLVTIDPKTGRYNYTINYYELGQFSKFVSPGAVRVARSGGSGLVAEAFRNPDGTDALVATNPGNALETLSVGWPGAGSFSYALPAGATVTFTNAN